MDLASLASSLQGLDAEQMKAVMEFLRANSTNYKELAMAVAIGFGAI